MSFVLVTQKVVDFDDWKSKYDSQLHLRRKSGLIDLHLLRDDSDPGTVILLFGTTDLDRAREFLSSSDWQISIRDSGVRGRPNIKFLNEFHWYEAH